MDARRIAAQFAACTWYEESRPGKQAPEEKGRFARKHWAAFLPVAQDGWGRLLSGPGFFSDGANGVREMLVRVD
jgi:hypothetical protein